MLARRGDGCSSPHTTPTKVREISQILPVFEIVPDAPEGVECPALRQGGNVKNPFLKRSYGKWGIK